MTRRTLLSSSALAAAGWLTPPLALRLQPNSSSWAKIGGHPDYITAYAESGASSLQRTGAKWQANGIEFQTNTGSSSLACVLHAPNLPLLRFHLRWQLEAPTDHRYLGDHWERSYGDLAWCGLQPERVMPWYFLFSGPEGTGGCGVKTGARALSFWQTDTEGVSLWLDVRNGGSGVVLADRQVSLAEVVTDFYPQVSPAVAARRFCARMCDFPRLPSAPVYGGNNWYYAYGKSSAEDIRRDSEHIASLAPSQQNLPFMVIDDGWEPNPVTGPFTHGNARFPDMPALAADMRKIGVQPGIWIRPLFTTADTPASARLSSPNAAAEYSKHQSVTLDPSIPEVLAGIQEQVNTIHRWGYSLIKHDFSTYDLFGRWGFRMAADITDQGWSFSDRSRTTAEIVLALYTSLRQAAGSSLLLGCNTIGHLGAGLFELQRTGDDTSGRDWNRTRKMGVNTLGFRIPQHDTFFAIDADCVGLTREIPWHYNRQWLDLLARSGTPLFVSAAPDALRQEQREAIRAAFTRAAQNQPPAVPEDWLETSEPARWRFDHAHASFRWYGGEGVSPFAT